MKSTRSIAKLFALILVASLMFALASCGKLELKSFTVDRSTVKTVYLVGEEIDFTGIKAMAKYSDKSLDKEYTYEELTIEYAPDITATPGNKSVSVSFMDPNLNVKQSTNVAITVNEDPNAVKHESYEADASEMKTIYFVGESLDFSGLVINDVMSDGSSVPVADISSATFEYANDITASTGVKSVTVKFGGEEAGVISITVKNPKISLVTLNDSTLDLEFNVGDTVSLDGLKATLKYENGEIKEVTSFTYVTDLSKVTETYGNKTIVLKYYDPITSDEYNATVNVKVDGVVSYTFSTENQQLKYYEGDTVSFGGVTVTAHYYFSGAKAVPASSVQFVHEDNLTATDGQKEITVKVGDTVVGKFLITVGNVPTATANTENVDLSYRVGETVDLTGLTVTINYSDSTPDATVGLLDVEVTTSLTTLSQTPGNKTVTIRYNDTVSGHHIYATFDVTVYGIDSYTADANNMLTSYMVGQSVNFNGLVMYANYLDGGESEVVNVNEFTFGDAGITATAGDKTIPVYKNGVQVATINVSVVKNSITSTVIGGTYKTDYLTTDTSTDFANLTITLTYADGSVRTLSGSALSFSALDLTTPGKKNVVITFTDPINNEPSSASISVTVIKKYEVVEFSKSQELTAFDSDNKSAGTSSYGDSGFSGQFLVGNQTYVIGDDNAFKLNPIFTVMDGTLKNLREFYSVVDLYLHNGTEYVLLTKQADPADQNRVSYYSGSDLIATVDIYRGSYQFTTNATGKQVKISVLPNSKYYTFSTINPVVLEAKVIDAWNAYTAIDLAVIDNSGRDEWTNFKTEHGLASVAPAGIVLHTDIHISASDLPADFFYVTENEVSYKNALTNEIVTAPKGTRYLKDGTDVYVRVGSADFVFEGNFFTLDCIKFPLVPSTAIFGKDSGRDYGSDFSNATLFVFETNPGRLQAAPSDIAYTTINNLALIGNAARNNFVDMQDNLASAGGLIFCKARNYSDVTFNNTIGNSYFISYFPDIESNVTITNVKCYDSYQNAIMLWGSTTCTMDNCYLNGAGGPLVIIQSWTNEDTGIQYNPVINATNTTTESHLTGQEIWFTAVNATTVVSNIQALGNSLEMAGLGNFSDDNNQMNIICGLITEGDDAAAIISDPTAQGTMIFDGHGIERWQDQAVWGPIYSHPAYTTKGANGMTAPFLSVVDSTGATHVLWTDGSNLYDIYGRALGTAAEHQAIFAAFATANRITLSQGGISVLLEFYH